MTGWYSVPQVSWVSQHGMFGGWLLRGWSRLREFAVKHRVCEGFASLGVVVFQGFQYCQLAGLAADRVVAEAGSGVTGNFICRRHRGWRWCSSICGGHRLYGWCWHIFRRRWGWRWRYCICDGHRRWWAEYGFSILHLPFFRLRAQIISPKCG